MPSQPGKLIVVGAGRWGLNHIKTANSIRALVGVVDNDQGALDRSLNLLGADTTVKFHLTLSAALMAHPDASVVVATPPNTHFAVARKAIGSHRHVLVEKPLCDSVARAEELVLLAEKAGVVLMVDHLLHYSVHHQRLMQLVRTGFVGQVTRIKMSRMNFGTLRVEENVLWSFTPHDVSILLSICGNQVPKTVSCVGQKVVSCGIDDYVDMSVIFDDGIHAQIEATWMHPLKERRMIVYGTSGALILNEAVPDLKAAKLQGFKWSAKRKSDGSAVTIEKHEADLIKGLNEGENTGKSATSAFQKPPLQQVQEHFLACQDTKAIPRTDGKEGLRVLKVLAAATESLEKEGTAVRLSTGEQSPKVFAHSTAVVDSGAIIGPGTKVWHFSHIMPSARLGPMCNIGQNVYIGSKAILGKNVKVQNNVSIYDAVNIADDVFLGPSCVLTNIKTPRSHFSRKHDYSQTVIGKGATIGANATIVCGVKLGPYCFVGAGAVVTKDVPAHALVYGNPATLQGWVSTIGTRLSQVAEMGDKKMLQCTESKEVYTLHMKGRDGSGAPCVVMDGDNTQVET